jgi:hypothetical protein
VDFSQALKGGERISRENWNAAGQFVVLQPGYPEGVPANANAAAAFGVPEGEPIKIRPYLSLRTADGSFVPWQPTVSDVLAEDWHTA